MADIAKITLKGESEAKNFIDEALRGDIAYEELSTTVSKTGGYVAGDHLIYLGQYYEVVADIAQGGTIVTSGAGQNVEEREVGDEIKKNKTQVVAQIQTLTKQANDMNNVLGAKNILPNNAVSKTVNGITFTVNSDGSITANGTATADAYFSFSYHNFKVGSYILNGCPNGGGTSGPYVLFVQKSTAPYVVAQDIGNGVTFTLSQDISLQVRCKIWSGQTVSNLTFYPMIRPASIQDDTYVPYSMTNREMTPYVQAITNPNLLDNPWFTVNQRGQSSYSGVGYTVDRWIIPSTKTTINVNSDNSVSLGGVEDNSNSFIQEKFDVTFFNGLKGKTVTFSIMLDDGTVLSKTGTFPSSYSTESAICSMYDTVLSLSGIYIKTSGQVWVQLGHVYNGTSRTIKAVKLELGSVSTLAMDTAPNYQQELAKCQRYFYRANMNIYCSYGIAAAWSTAGARMLYQTPVPMRVKPAITFGDISAFKLRNGSTYLPITQAILYGPNNTDKFYFELNATTVSGTIYTLDMTATSYIDFSADL